MATLHVSFHINFWSTLTIQLGHHNKMPAWRLQDTTESFTDSCGACASIWSRTPRHGIAVLISFHPKSKASWTWWFTGDRRWRLHLSLSGNAVPIVWLPESATRSSGHPFQNRSYCRVVLGSFPIRPPADFGLAFASNLFDWKCYNCGDVAWALRSLGAAIATVCVCLSGWAVGSLCCTCSSCVEVSWCGKFGVTLSAPVKQKPCWISSKSWVAPNAVANVLYVWLQARFAVGLANLMSVAASLRDQHHHWHHPNTPDSTDHGASPRLHRGPSLTQRWQAQWWATLSSGTFERKFRPSFFWEAPGYWGTILGNDIGDR